MARRGDKFRGLHVVHEKGVVSTSGYDADFDAVLGVPVQELIVHEHLHEHKPSLSQDPTGNHRVRTTNRSMNSNTQP